MKSSIFQNKLGGIVIVTCMLLCALSSSTAFADSCTPDVSGQDSITKKPVQRWRLGRVGLQPTVNPAQAKENAERERKGVE